MRASAGAFAIVALVALAPVARADTGEAAAKVLGYGFGDGNYNPFSDKPKQSYVRATLGKGGAVGDMVHAACLAGYGGPWRVQVNGVLIPDACAYFDGGKLAADVKVLAFAFPFGGDFGRFASEAPVEHLHAFVSGFLQYEGGCGAARVQAPGLIDDQSVGYSGYSSLAQIKLKMGALKVLLTRLGFTTARVTCGTTKCALKISETEGCLFHSRFGYAFPRTYRSGADWGLWRVPGCTGTAAPFGEPPSACPAGVVAPAGQ